MTTKQNDNWLYDLTNAVKLLFNAKNQQLEKLAEYSYKDSQWMRLPNVLNMPNGNGVKYTSIDAPIDRLEKISGFSFQNFDSNYIKSKMSWLRGMSLDVQVDCNGDHPIHFIPLKTGRMNEFWAVTLITYIQTTEGNLQDYEFAKKFIELIKCLEESGEQPKKQQTATTPQSPKTGTPDRNVSIQPEQNITQVQQDMTLILVFGQSHKSTINEIKDRKQLNEGDFELLENKCEWFWYGLKENRPSEIANDVQDNMCWLRLDIRLPNAQQVQNLLHLKDLIKKIKKQPEILTQIISSNNTFNLNNKVFTKA